MSNDPYQTLTADEMAILRAHYELVKDCTSHEQVERILKPWTDKQRRVVVMLQNRLRSEGWVIDGQFPSGSLRFVKTLRSKTDQIRDLSDEEFELYRKGKLRFVDGVLMGVSA